MINKMFKIQDNTKSYIMYDLIEPSYKKDVKEMLDEKKCWKMTGITFEVVSKVLVAMGGVLSFSAGYFINQPILSFISGSVSTISLACLQFSSFSYIQNEKQTKELNILLKSLDLDPIPVIVLDTDTDKPENV